MMAKELRHKDAVSARVREDEFEHTRQHIINSQATGDLVYASSATQLSGLAVGADNYILSVATDTPAWISPASLLADISPLTTRGDIMFRNATISTRLAKGAANTVLVMGADDPAWSATLAGLTLTSPTINGTIATTGLTVPALTLSGSITGAAQTMTGMGTINGLAITADTGVITSGTWNATVITPVYGGTGVANNVASTLTITGAYGITLTVSNTTALTLPTSGTVATTANITTDIATHAALLTGIHGITIAQTLQTIGAYAIILRASAATDITLPTTGTLATLAGTEELDNKTLDASVAKGTWTASGTWIVPDMTLGGTLSAAGHGIRDASSITITDGNSFRCNVDNGFIRVSGGTDINSATIQLSGKSREPNPGMFQIFTPIADLSYTPRLSISGAVATAVAAWSGVYHTGVKFGLAGVATGAFTIDGSTSGVVTVTVNAEAGTWTMTLPAAVGTAGYFLVDAAGNGITSWSNTLPAATVAAGYIQFTEMAAPGALGANTAGIYAVVGGDTLTDLAAVFQDGTVDIFAEESTDPDSPIFRYPDGTEFKSILKKPDKKTVQFVALFPDGSEFVMREKRYPVERWN